MDDEDELTDEEFEKLIDIDEKFGWIDDYLKKVEKLVEERIKHGDVSTMPITMVAERYSYADEMKMTAQFNDYPHVGTPFAGIYKLCDGLYTKVVEEEWRLEEKRTRYFYGEMKEKGLDLPPYESLLAMARERCAEFSKDEENGDMYLPDIFSSTAECPEMRRFYEVVYDSDRRRKIAAAMNKNERERPLDWELRKKDYKLLGKSLKNIDVTFNTYNCYGQLLCKVFTFAYDENVKEWIKTKYYELEDRAESPLLFDIAFFKEGRCIFSRSDELMCQNGE